MLAVLHGEGAIAVVAAVVAGLSANPSTFAYVHCQVQRCFLLNARALHVLQAMEDIYGPPAG